MSYFTRKIFFKSLCSAFGDLITIIFIMYPPLITAPNTQKGTLLRFGYTPIYEEGCLFVLGYLIFI